MTGMATGLTDTATSRLSPGEVEAIARLILRDEPIRIQPGEWWGYNPNEAILSYPRTLLAVWPAAKVLGAVCHEIAEINYSGRTGADVFYEFARAGEAAGAAPNAAILLLNAVNDLRVNRLYMSEFAGSTPFFAALYADQQSLDPKDDVGRRRPGTGSLPHHQFLDALTRRWAEELWSNQQQPDWPESIERALEYTWPAVVRAFQTDSLETTAGVLLESVLPTYVYLFAQSQEIMKSEAETESQPAEGESSRDISDDGPASSDEVGGDTGSDKEEDGPGPETEPEEAWVIIREPEERIQDEMAERTPPPTKPANPIPPGEKIQQFQRKTASWSGGTIQRFHRLNRRPRIDYEDFDYLGAVKNLEPQIDAVINGTEGSNGLAAILNTRRFGSADPWRRPRRSLRGETGEIDFDHPENLLINPDIAFLRGVKRKRDDGQKDFANAILLDVSGSVIQYGYESKKFAQLVETLVVFCEIHERLKLPYQLMAFSERAAVLRSFAECRYEHLHLDPTSAYIPKDSSHLVRELYTTEHAETLEARAIELALTDVSRQRGLKTILMVTDGISSDRDALVRVLHTVEERNAVSPANEAVMLLAFGLGLSQTEFKASYEPVVGGRQLRCSKGQLVPNINALPAIVCNVVENRIRGA